MNADVPHDVSAQPCRIAARYGAAAGAEWERLVGHLSLADNFALVVLAVPDQEAALLCNQEVGRLLDGDVAKVVRFEPADAEGLGEEVGKLIELQPDGQRIAVWLAGVVPESDPSAALGKWWKLALEGLNRRRNTLTARLTGPVFIVVAPWVLPIFRDEAPDLWSIRTLVVRI